MEATERTIYSSTGLSKLKYTISRGEIIDGVCTNTRLGGTVFVNIHNGRWARNPAGRLIVIICDCGHIAVGFGLGETEAAFCKNVIWGSSTMAVSEHRHADQAMRPARRLEDIVRRREAS